MEMECGVIIIHQFPSPDLNRINLSCFEGKDNWQYLN